MELCHHLRLLFDKQPDSNMHIKDLQNFINDKLDKDYTIEQVIVGMDYAGFKRVKDYYLVKIASRNTLNK